MSATSRGMIHWEGHRDNDGHREYIAKWQVKTSSAAIGPAAVFAASGVPSVGTAWFEDPWAFCLPDLKATPILTKEPNTEWILEQKYSTRPLKRCQTTAIEDPLDEPPRLSGSFVRYVREATIDRNGNPIRSSSHELLRGKNVERDWNKPQVFIEMNFATSTLSTFAPMIDTVNDSTLWGLPARTVKLSNAPWRRLLYGSCSYFFTVTFEFDIDYNGWDRTIIDEGTKVLACGGNAANPRDFVAYKDGLGENGKVILDGNGNAWSGTGDPGYVDIEFYTESNMLLLGIPSSLS